MSLSLLQPLVEADAWRSILRAAQHHCSVRTAWLGVTRSLRQLRTRLVSLFVFQDACGVSGAFRALHQAQRNQGPCGVRCRSRHETGSLSAARSFWSCLFSSDPIRCLQLRCAGLCDAIRIYRAGFPFRLTYQRFAQRFAHNHAHRPRSTSAVCVIFRFALCLPPGAATEVRWQLALPLLIALTASALARLAQKKASTLNWKASAQSIVQHVLSGRYVPSFMCGSCADLMRWLHLLTRPESEQKDVRMGATQLFWRQSVQYASVPSGYITLAHADSICCAQGRFGAPSQGSRARRSAPFIRCRFWELTLASCSVFPQL